MDRRLLRKGDGSSGKFFCGNNKHAPSGEDETQLTMYMLVWNSLPIYIGHGLFCRTPQIRIGNNHALEELLRGSGNGVCTYPFAAHLSDEHNQLSACLT
jgi:hypothetical protein